MRVQSILAAGLAILATILISPPRLANADTFRSDQWYLNNLKIPQVHNISVGSGISVGLIDTGTYPHPDFRRNLFAGVDLVPGEDGAWRSDQAGHGTNMAALIAGHGRGTSDGILGIAPAAKILSIKISNDENAAPADPLAEGITWATSRGADVINISAAIGPSFKVRDAVAAALAANVVVIASVGNTSSSAIIGYPAAFDGVLAVGAVGRNGKHSSISVKDPKVQICAPGVQITTAQPKDKYVDVDGTSPAAAIVSGAAALVRAKFPKLSANEVVHRLTATADDIGPPGRDIECGFGLLNIVKALTADVPPLEVATASPSATAPTTAATAAPTAASSAPSANTEAEPASANGPLLLGALAGVAVAGALVAILLVRRRRAP